MNAARRRCSHAEAAPFAARRSGGDRLSVRAAVRAAEPDGSVVLELDEGASCAACAGRCTWIRPRRAYHARLSACMPLEPGDRVHVSLPSSRLLAAACLLHGLPLAALLAGGAIGAALGGSDAGCLAGAVGGLAVAFAASRSLRRHAERFTVEAVKVEPLP